MRVTSLSLENVKSYRQISIDLSAGVNAICGPNGSGKTTIVEALGFALFNFLPYNQAAFVREREKTGTIRVCLTARDGRDYEVVRKVGGSSAYYVADAESGMHLADRKENVLDWIATQALGIDRPEHLEALFKDAVGVPQGSMTVDFTRATAQRKMIFDPLLRVEEYRDAFERLRDTVSHVRDLTNMKKQEIARLESKVEQIPTKRDERKQIELEASAATSRLTQAETELAELAGQLTRAEDVAERLRQLQNELDSCQAAVQRYDDMLGLQRRGLQSCQAARLVVEASEPGYQRYLRAKMALAELETRRNERDQLKEQLAAAQSSRDGVYGRIESLDVQVRQAEDAALKAATLVEIVAHQADLEYQLQEARATLREIEQVEQQTRKTKDEIATLERVVSEREVRLERSRTAVAEAGKLQEAQVLLQQVGEQLAALQPLKEQAEALKAEGQRWRNQLDMLHEDLRHLDTLLVKVADKRRHSDGLEELTLKLQDLRDERTQLAATIEYQTLARADLARRHCPLLEIQCPAMTADAGMIDRFDTRVSGIAGRLSEVRVELSAAEADFDKAQSAAKELQALQIKAAQLEAGRERLADVEERLQTYRIQYRDLTLKLQQEPELQQTQRVQLALVSRLKVAVDAAAQLPVLEEQQAQDRARLDEGRADLVALAKRRAELQMVEARAGELSEQLTALSDPRSRQQQLLALAQRKPQLAKSIEEEQIHLAEYAAKVKAFMGTLQAFEKLDGEIDAQRLAESESAEDHERYLASKDEAALLDERSQAVVDTETALKAARAAECTVQQQLEETRARYNKDSHTWLKERCDELGKQAAVAKASHLSWSGRLKDVDTELASLERQNRRLVSARMELDELDHIAKTVSFIRDTIKAAGPAITETLLGNISQTANDIFAEIMDDHAAELRWNKEYEILVQRGAETRGFAQLSGGEQMSAALAVRLALLKEMSDIDFAFFDEPTQNMDGERRANLADQIRAIKGFDQLIVISHDDTFEHHTDSLIRLQKENEETRIETD